MTHTRKKPEPLFKTLLTFFSLLLPPVLVAYAFHGFSQSDIYLFGRYQTGGHFHNTAAWCESAMLLCVAAAISCDAFLTIYHWRTRASGEATIHRLHTIKWSFMGLVVILLLLGLIFKFQAEGLPWQKQPRELDKVPSAPVSSSALPATPTLKS